MEGGLPAQGGRVTCVPLLGPVRYLRRLPEHMRLGGGRRARVEPVQKGERELVMELHDAPVLPHFVAGILEMGLRATRVEPTLGVRVLDAGRHGVARVARGLHASRKCCMKGTRPGPSGRGVPRSGVGVR